jgi:hypothetical protein
MNSNPNRYQQKENPSSGNPKKSASTGAVSARRPPPAAVGGGANPSSTGDEKKKWVCHGSANCKDFHCKVVTHANGYTRPTECWFVQNGKHCFICNKDDRKASDKSSRNVEGSRECPLPSVNCDKFLTCADLECTKKHDPRLRVKSVPVPESESAPIDLGIKNFPSLSFGNVAETQPVPIYTGTNWASMVGGGSALTEKLFFSKQIVAIVATVPEIFGKDKADLALRLMACSTPQELLSILKGMYDAFTEFSNLATVELGKEESDENALMELVFDLLKKILGEDLKIPEDLPDDTIQCVAFVLEMGQNFSKVYDEVLPSITLVDESLKSSDCFSSTSLVQSAPQVLHAIRQMREIEAKVSGVDVLQACVLTNMIQALSSIASSNISSTTWCLESLIGSMLASANNLLKEVTNAEERKKLEEQKRLYELLLNPKCESSGTADHLMACLCALSFYTNNAELYGRFVSFLSDEEKTCLKKNLDKYFECLVSQIFKSLLAKGEITKEYFRDSNEEYLMNFLNSAFVSLNHVIQNDSTKILNFLQKFIKEQRNAPFFSPAFVNFMYSTHVFNGNEGANPMSKLWAWYASVLKDYFKLEISCENLVVRFCVFDNRVDERGDTHKEKVDITDHVMRFLFEMVCFAEVCRRNGKEFPYGNISHKSSLAITLNKVGKMIDQSFTGYSRLKDNKEQAACPYDSSFKTTIRCESNSDVVQRFLEVTLRFQTERLDEKFKNELNDIRSSFIPQPENLAMFNSYAALFCIKERSEISTILKGMQILLSKDAKDAKNAENLGILKSLMKGDFFCLGETIFKTSIFFLKSESRDEADKVRTTFLQGIKEILDMVLSSGITFEDITIAHEIMRKFYMSNRHELYLHPCLIAIILALTQRYKVSFQDVYNMVRSAMKNMSWKAFSCFSEEDPVRKAINDLQPQSSDFSFQFALERHPRTDKDKIVLSIAHSFWCTTTLVGVKSTESKEVLHRIQCLISSVITPILLSEVYSKNVEMRPSSIIDLLNNVITFRLMGPNFKHLMKLFGITDLNIKDISSEQPPSSSILDAFSSGVGFQTMGNVAQSMFDRILFDHKKDHPEYIKLSKAERRSALELIRNTVLKDLVEKFLRLGLGLTVDLTDLPVIDPFVVFNIVRTNMSLFDLPFFKKLLRVINDGLYANSFHSTQARKARACANKIFLESQSGDAVGAMTFSDAIHEAPKNNSDNFFRTIDEVIKALVELFSGDKKKSGFDIPSELNGFDIGSILDTFPPTIMACQSLIPLFPPPTKGNYTEFPEDYNELLISVLGITMSDGCGGIDYFNAMLSLSHDSLVFQYASLISLGNEDLSADVLKSEFYDRLLYLLQGLQYFSSINVEEMVKEALAPQREQNDK